MIIFDINEFNNKEVCNISIDKNLNINYLYSSTLINRIKKDTTLNLFEKKLYKISLSGKIIEVLK